MSEQEIQRKIIKWLEENECYVVKVISASKVGVPDIIACVDGHFVAIEVKKPETKANVSALQAYNLDRVVICGGHSLVAWNLDMVKDYLRTEGLI